jgi:DNA-binding GntR family transcriptional regulator
VARVRAAVDEGRAAARMANWDGVASANQHFHRALVAMGGSPRLDQQMKLLLAEMRLVFHRMSEVREFHEPYLDRNDAICDLLEAGDRAAAAEEVRRYLSDAESQILDAYARL